MQNDSDNAENNLCLPMLITGTLQNVRELQVIRKAADKDGCKSFALMKAAAQKEGGTCGSK